MKSQLAAFFFGLLFALGLGVSGMIDPANVIGFLDVLGHWRVDLALVMASAVIVNLVTFRLILKRPNPLFCGRFHLPKSKVIDGKLIVGAVLFGAGWGLTGWCPGPILVSLSTLNGTVWLFAVAMLVGLAAGEFGFFARLFGTESTR